MAFNRSLMTMLKEAERASKREHFDPSSVKRKPRWPWLDVAVGQTFTVRTGETTGASLAATAYNWQKRTGRVYSVKTIDGGWLVTRTD